jgi:pyruvate formate lyase activating enzyme
MSRSFWGRRLTRREFIKKGVAGVAGITAAGYALNYFWKRSMSLPEPFDMKAPDRLWKWSREGYHYTKLGDNVQCNVCPNNCILSPDDRSICRNKVNKGGKLYTLAYGNPCAVHVDPIEKKPLYHFLPTSSIFSIATAGCNFRCLNCQNWQISQQFPEKTQNVELMPNAVVANAIAKKCTSIAYTYSEPTAFYEYMYDTAKLASAAGIKNVSVTNGYTSREALKDLCQYLDASNVDLKGFNEETHRKLNSGKLKPVMDTLKRMKEEGVWLEVTNLVVPGWTDDLDEIGEMCSWLYKNIGADNPLHFSRFSPMYKLRHLQPTPLRTLEKARQLALDAGLHYVYIGNVPGTDAQNTYCPKCGKIVIERKGYVVAQDNVKNGVCEFCGEKIAGVWQV